MSGYPDFEGRAYSFQRAELSAAGTIYTAITNVEFDQPTEEGAVMGTKPYPLMRTVGEMGLGEGTITFSDEGERFNFLDGLGAGWRDKTWSLTWVLSSPGKPNIKLACQGCRVLSNPISHEGGGDGLGGDVTFSFLSHTINGKTPHEGMPSPTASP